jgi:CIC family chloride channel protein
VEVTIVSMIAFFGGISKAPISVLIMGTEMTGGFGLFLPLMLATITSYFVSGKKYSIYRAQVLNRAASPAHIQEYEKPIMSNIRVEDAMKTDFPFATPDMNLSEAFSLITSTPTKIIVVLDKGKLQGMISLEKIISQDSPSSQLVKDHLITDVKSISVGNSLIDAMNVLTSSTEGKIVVTDPEKDNSVVGTLSFTDIAASYNRELRKFRANPR